MTIDRNSYRSGDTLPDGVDFGVAIGPWWYLTAIDPTWNHITTSNTQWHSEPQTCHTCGNTCTPALTLTFSATHRMHWCNEHAGDAAPHRGPRAFESHGGPGWWVPVPNGKTRLICCSRASGERHPELDDMLFDTPRDAMRFVWEKGLIELEIRGSARVATH